MRRELLTDLYELTMAACYFEKGFDGMASFSLYVRDMPRNRGYLVAAGLEEALSYLEGFSFSQEDLNFLDSTGLFKKGLLDFLKGLSFQGEVFALKEGTVFFPHEPLLEVTAPIIQAQMLETYLLNVVNLESTIATKASRCYLAGRGRLLTDFALRRTHGMDAGLKVARSSFIGGFAGTSNVLAGKLFGIPIFGTMAHSYVSVHKDETGAFLDFAEVFPKGTILLIDTYDTLQGAKKALSVAKMLKEKGQIIIGVRLDSGDIVELSQKVRAIFNKGGFPEVKIFVSGSLDEYVIADLLKRGASIDGFGVGTKMGVSADAPYLDVVYKITEYEGRNLLKLSTGKVTLVGRKQVYRRYAEGGQMEKDTLCLRHEHPQEGEPLLVKVMEKGKRTLPPEGLTDIKTRCLKGLSALPEGVKRLEAPDKYPLSLGPGLAREQAEEEEKARKMSLGR